MQTVSEAVSDAHRARRRLHGFVAFGLLGLTSIVAGLGVDAVLHARNADLAAEEGLLTLENPGHVLLGAGILATGVGVVGAAVVLMRSAADPPRILQAGQLLFGAGIIVLVVAMGYAIAGPGLGHSHDHGGIADAAMVSERYTNIPPDEAVALVELSLTRAGSLDAGLVHDHGAHVADAELSPDDARELAEQLAKATAVVPDLDTVEEAQEAGYVPSAPHAEGVGVHWTKWSWVDEPFDPEKPSQLLFEEVTAGKGPELVAFSYWVSSPHEPEGFAGGTDAWHQHLGLCFEDGIVTNEEVPDRTQCAGDWINGNDLWMLHAWVVPGMENRLGVFGNINPRLCERFCE